METQYPEFQKAIHRLHDVGVTEVSLVRKPANRRQFALYKSEEDPISEALEESPTEDELVKDYGENSVANQTRFGSGGHFTPSGNSPPTKASKREEAYIEAWRLAQQDVRDGKYPTVEQAFAARLNDPKFLSLIYKHYGWDEEAEDEGIDPFVVLEKEYDEPVDVAIEKALSEFSDEMPYEDKLSALFAANPELELRWLYQR